MWALSCPFGFHRDNVKWSEDQAAAAERKVRENSSQLVCAEKQGALCSARSRQCGTRPLKRAKEVWVLGSFVTGLMKDSGIVQVGEGAAF